MNGLFQELKRRKVLRVAALYIVGAWVVIQVLGEAFEAWAIPGEALRYVWIAAVLGFPLALVFGWRYDLTSAGIVRTRPTDRSAPTDTSLQSLDYLILAALAVVVGIIVYGAVRQAVEVPVNMTRKFADEPVDPKSVAVLPFENMSGDEANVPFTVGIHDDILTQVSKISELKVISRTSVARLDPTMNILDIGRLLGVATVLEGGVQRVGNELRINVQLIDAANDDHMWAETFDREMSTSNIFAIQSDIAEAVAAALRATLSNREQRNLRKIPTRNLEAYEAYLIGRQQMALRAIPALREASDSFERAVELDPDYALAHVGLADTLLLLNSYGAMPLDEAVSRATSLLNRALELDSELGAAHASIGLSYARREQVSEAIAAYKRAIELDPNYAPAHHWYGDILFSRLADAEGALPLLQRARELDPLSPVINITMGEIYTGLGRFDEALAIAEKVMGLEPGYPGAYNLIGNLYHFAFGRIDKSIRWHIEELRTNPGRPTFNLGFAYLDLGDDTQAQHWLNRAVAGNPDSFWSALALNQLHRYRNEPEEAIHYAEQLQVIAPVNNTTLFTLVLYGRDARVLEILVQHFPDFRCDEVPVDGSNLFEAINISLAMERTGEVECANRLLNEALRVIHTMPRLGGRGYGIADVEIYARQGKKELALATLREAIDAGWRAGWWAQGLTSPHNANIADDPRFVAMMDEIRADLAGQLDNVRGMEASGELDLP